MASILAITLSASAEVPVDSQARRIAREAYRAIRDHSLEGQVLETAAKELDRAHALEPNEAYVWLGASLLASSTGYGSGDDAEARSYAPAALAAATALAQKAVAADPSLVDAHSELAWLFVIQRRFAEAKQEYYVAHQIDPEDFDVWFGQSVCWWKQGEASKSEAALAGAASRAKTPQQQVTLNSQRMRMARSRGNRAEQERLLRENIALKPNSPWTHGNYAGFLMGQGRLDEAIKEYERAIAIAPYPIARQGLEEAKRRREAARKNPIP